MTTTSSHKNYDDDNDTNRSKDDNRSYNPSYDKNQFPVLYLDFYKQQHSFSLTGS